VLDGLRGRLNASRFRRPVIATGPAMAAIAGAAYLVGGVIGLFSAVLQQDSDGDVYVLALSLVAIALGCGLGIVAVRGHRLPDTCYHLLALAPIGVITLGIRAERENLLAMALASLLILVTIFAFAFFTWVAAWSLQVLSVVALIGAKLAWDAMPWMAAVAMSVQNVILAVILGWLVRAAARAETDDLTGLPDRRGFERALASALDRAARIDRPLSLAFLDLDDFAAVNEQRGRAAGDQLLHLVAQEWAALVGSDGALARYGGDRFALLLPLSVSQAAELLERFPKEFSAGIAGRCLDDTPVTLSGRAEAALEEARRAGGSRVFCSADGAADNWAEMAAALSADEFTVVYQPIVDLGSGRTTGAEALLRWVRADGAPVSPVDFIPRAERSGFIVELGRFVLETAGREAAEWAVPGKITVNVSGRELHQPGYYDQVTTTLMTTGLPPERLVLEVTESMLEADSPVALETLRRLRALGIRIAVDDFGTGWSSLSRLDRLPADILKIDRSFVAAIAPEATSAPLVAAITALAAALGLRTVAEGVEEEHQATVLARHGVDEVQGWLHGRPGDSAAIRAALGRPAVDRPDLPVTDRVSH
jgi:EAL domain-containing protein (putative c-di-GMP-specific phosphodiesterase class I)/GGDEF domain-containing protein